MSYPPSSWLLAGAAGLLLAGCQPATDSATATTQASPPAAVSADSTLARPTVADFGRTPDGQAVQLYTLRNAHGMQATITTYGGIVTSLLVPDKAGKVGNVVLGFDSLAGYTSRRYQQESPYFGALIGRYGNRIARGRFTLDGKTYQLPINNPPNSLHGGPRGFNRRVWQAVPGTSADGPTLALTYVSQDGEEGYPGTLTVRVTYTLTAANTLRIAYAATTDKPTVLNLTNHSYFNLAYGQAKDVLGHELTLLAERFTPVDNTLIPTGKLQPVADTPMDFRQPHAIGERLAQVPGAAPGGYDHNWVLADQMRPALAKAAAVYEPTTGRTLEVFTDQPGIQFYSGNFLKGNLRGRGGVAYPQHYGFCLETQHFPDSPNEPTFPSTVLQPGQQFASTTEYRFGVRP